MLFNSNLIAIDWDKNHIRLLKFSKERAGSVRVHDTVSEPIATGVVMEDADRLGAFIKELIQKHRLGSSDVVYTVGRERASLHALTIPASPEDQVANLVRFQLAQELPFAIEESVVDYVITRRNESDKVTGVLAAAVMTEYIDFLKHISRVAGLKLRRVGLRPYAHFLAVQKTTLLDDKVTLFVDINHREMEIDMFSKEEGVFFSRNIGLDGSRGGEAAKDEFLDQTALQVKRTIHAQAHLMGSQPHRPQQVLIAGSTGWEEELSDRIATQLSLPAHVVALPGLEKSSCAFVAGYGLAVGQCRSRTDQFNFLTPKRAVDPQAIRARQIRLGVATVAVLMIMSFVYSQRLISTRKTEYNRLVEINNQLDRDIREFRGFSAHMNEKQSWIDRKANWLDLLKDLTELLPDTDQTYLTQMNLAESTHREYQAEISVRGQAKSRQMVNQMAQKLMENGMFRVVLPQQTTTSGSFPINFNMSLSAVKSTSDPKPDPEPVPAESQPAEPNREETIEVDTDDE